MIEKELTEFVNQYTKEVVRVDVEVWRFRHGSQGEQVQLGVIEKAPVRKLIAPVLSMSGCTSHTLMMGSYPVLVYEQGVRYLIKDRSRGGDGVMQLVLSEGEMPPDMMEKPKPKVQNADFAELIFKINDMRNQVVHVAAELEKIRKGLDDKH